MKKIISNSLFVEKNKKRVRLFYDKNIMVNCISPTKTNTPMIKKLFPNIDENKIIDVNVMANYMINILCTSISNKTTGVIYKISN